MTIQFVFKIRCDQNCYTVVLAILKSGVLKNPEFYFGALLLSVGKLYDYAPE